MGFLELVGSEDEKLEEIGEGCFISHKRKGNRGGKSCTSTGCTTEGNERAGSVTLGQMLSDTKMIVGLTQFLCI